MATLSSVVLGKSCGQRTLVGYSPWGSQKSWVGLSNSTTTSMSGVGYYLRALGFRLRTKIVLRVHLVLIEQEISPQVSGRPCLGPAMRLWSSLLKLGSVSGVAISASSCFVWADIANQSV